LWRYGKNRHITQNLSECSGPILAYFTCLVGALVGMIFQIFVWQSPKGRCYGNQINMGDVHKRRMGPPLFFASAFDNGLADCKSAFKRFNGNNQATLSKCGELQSSNLGVYAVKMSNFCRDSPAKGPQFDDDLQGCCHGNQLKSKNWRFLRTNLFCHTAIWKRIAISHFRFQKIR